MAAISKPAFVNYTCYELGHCWTPYCTKASFDIALSVVKEGFKIYASLYLIAGVLRKKKKEYFMKKVWLEILQSTLFLSTNGTLFLTCFCLWRHLRGSMSSLNTFAFMPAAVGSLVAILQERKSRRGLLALYMGNVALETLWRMMEARGYVRSIANGEVLLFSIAAAGYLYYFKKKDGLPEGTLSILKKLLGPDETAEDRVGVDEGSGQKEVTNNNRLSSPPRHHHRIQTMCRNAVGAVQRCPSHSLCRHKHSCIYYVLKGSVRMFGVGYALQAGIRLVSSLGRVLKQPKSVIRALFNRSNAQLGAFLGCFVAIYRAVNCLLRWLRDRDEAQHGLLAGFLAGWSMLFYKGPTLALYTASKLAEMMYCKGIAAGKLPYIHCADIIIYSLSTALVFHTAVLEPHNLRPAYWSFLLRITGNRYAYMNRKLLDPYVPNSSKLFPDYWPDYDPRFTSLVRPKS